VGAFEAVLEELRNTESPPLAAAGVAVRAAVVLADALAR
jgi:hypothetical protein